MIKNLNKIHPIKRDKIKKGMMFIADSNKDSIIVTKVVAFGSAVTNNCTNDSDIDVCLFTNVPISDRRFFMIHGKLPFVMDDLCDVLVYDLIGDNLKNEIDKKGVTVYE